MVPGRQIINNTYILHLAPVTPTQQPRLVYHNSCFIIYQAPEKVLKGVTATCWAPSLNMFICLIGVFDRVTFVSEDTVMLLKKLLTFGEWLTPMRSYRGAVDEWVRALAWTDDRTVPAGFESHCGKLRFETLL